jgi:tetratricopeptide (TPR) repeat protein
MRYLIVLALLFSCVLHAQKADPYKKVATLIAEKKYTQAFVVLNDMIGKNNKDLKAYDLMASMYRAIGGEDNIRVAESYYYQILRQVPGDLMTKMDLATCSYLLGHTEKARIIFEEIYRQNPRIKKLNYYLGSIAFFDRDQLENARRYLRKELEINSKDAEALFVLGISYEYDGKGDRRAYSTGVDTAVLYYKEALKIEPENPSALFNLSIAYSIKNEQDKAIRTAEKLLKVKEAKRLYMSTYYNIACFYALKKDSKKAIENLKKAIDSGFSDFDHMKKDSDLSYIKDDKEFKALLN